MTVPTGHDIVDASFSHICLVVAKIAREECFRIDKFLETQFSSYSENEKEKEGKWREIAQISIEIHKKG